MRAQIMHVTQACHTTEHTQLSIQLPFLIFPPTWKKFTLQFPVVSGLEMKILQSIEKDLSPCHTYTEVGFDT